MKKALSVLLLLQFLCSFSVLAQTEVTNIINRVKEAYGGDELVKVKSLQLEDHYKSFRYGQSHSPNSIDMVSNKSLTTVDLINKRKDFKWVRGDASSFATQHQLYDGKKGYRVEHDEKTISVNNSMSMSNVDRSHVLFLDTRLAMLVIEYSASAEVVGRNKVKGRLLDEITFEPEGYPKLTLYVDVASGRIVKMKRPSWRPEFAFDYYYNDFTKREGVGYAKSFYVTRGGQPFYVSTQRKLSINKSYEAAFTAPQNYEAAAASFDFKDMSVTPLSENLYLVGKNWGFSIFYEAEEHLVASGTYNGLTERLNALHEHLGRQKPLKYQIITHHHNDHLGGVNEVVALGASFVTLSHHVQSIKKLLDETVSDERFVLADDLAEIEDGNIHLINFSNDHAENNLLSYFATDKVIFTADLFLSRLKSGSPSGYESLKDFATMLDQRNIQVQRFAAAHSGRVLTDADLTYAINHIQETTCPSGWTICPASN